MQQAQIEQLENQGNTVVLVTRDNTLLGILALRDTVQPEARQAVDGLRELGIQGLS
jgi:Cd2+/Zn2+-exporting ATPase